MTEHCKYITVKDGRNYVTNDWFPHPLPKNLLLDPESYPDTAYSFIRFQSEIENAFILGYGSGNYGHSHFIGGINSAMIIGKYVVLEGTAFLASNSISVGDNCMFSWGSVASDSWIIQDNDIDSRRKILIEAANSKTRLPDFNFVKPVVIEENVWVGFKAIIFPGVTLGRGSIIGSCSVVTEDVPPYAIVAGNPARIIRFLLPTDTEQVKNDAIRELSLN